MPIEPPNLDDRRFQDIVDETKRMIPRFTPEWTNHNLSDPGVALIELFAWMSETVLYRVNQVPERLYVHFLNLVGVEPFPPSVARTDIIFRLSAPATRPVVVPAGTEVATTAGTGESSVVFTTSAETTAEPPELLAAHTRAADSEQIIDVTEALHVPGEEAACFSESLIEGDALYLGMRRSLARHVVQLDVAAHAAGIGVDPTRPPLAWEVWTGEAWAPAQVEQDTTGGLNTDGRLVLLIGPDHALLVLGGTGAFWIRARLLRATPLRPGYEASPRIRALTVSTVGLSVPAEHSTAVPGEVLGRSAGVAGQVFTVSTAPVAARREDEGVVVADMSGSHRWSEVSDFARSGPTDRHVVWDSATGEVRFGPAVRQPDGSSRQYGAIPPDGATVRVTGYRTGGGSRGNVGAGTLTVLRSAVPMVASASNPRSAVGGVDAETVDEAKVRGPLSLRSGQRAVTAGDFEQVAREASVEVARARCLPTHASGSGVVQLLVVPTVRTPIQTHVIDDYALDTQLFEEVARAVDERRLVGVPVEVGTPYYQGVSVAALVRGLPGRPAAAVRQRVTEALTRFVHPGVGGSDGVGWPFGEPLTAAALTQVIESVDGVLAVDELQLFSYDLRNGRRLGEGRERLPLSDNALFLSADHRVVIR
ncbi:putative baseplate assembly protein [Ruania alkalisoli]|uniref:Putative baseplate assembly protein n=1 Tax=Ruania alkalisoli TaxID=2779775 RepID=A0A7M1STA3_9MICO|nr:putative baseplate assembly protein [Ruania alkalisoli]QOR70357.1 putative baseplate assembly protein [Ruania alkalisoli]